MEVCDCVECRKAQIVAVHIDTLPYAPPKQTGEEAFMEILLREHKSAMRRYPQYREFLERHGSGDTPTMKLESMEAVGLMYQRRRYFIGAKRRHREIWAAVRASDRNLTGKKSVSIHSPSI